MMKALTSNKLLVVSATALFLCLVISWILYGLFGHRLIEAMYNSESTGIVNKIMAGKAITPLEDYYEKADWLMWVGTFRLVIPFLALVVLMRKPRQVVLLCSSFLFFSSLLFCLFEFFPSFVQFFGLDRITYYSYKECCIPDDILVFREKPFFSGKIPYKGNQYSPLYGETPPIIMEWTDDANGFRNNSATGPSDVVAIGDSFIAFALNEADTFGKRLQRISGLTVANLGVGGYGPFQYLEILKRYGIERKPKYALFSFYAGNDLTETEDYLRGRRGEAGYLNTEYSLSRPFLQRYIIALVGIVGYFRDAMWLTTKLALNNYQDPEKIHPDIAVLNLGGKNYKMRLDGTSTVSADNILKSEEGQVLRNILVEFKNICVGNGVVPIIMYIPYRTDVYAEYSTEQSGKNWRARRDQLIAAKGNAEEAIARLSQDLGVALIDLSPVFDSAVKNGTLLYYPFDTHWNSEGREVAAEFVAKRLQPDL